MNNAHILQTEGINIEKIVHISDIKICDSNKEKLKNAFQKLYAEIDEITKTNKILICICGNLSGTDEYSDLNVEMYSDFLQQLCNYGSVVMVPGECDFDPYDQYEDDYIVASILMRNRELKNNFYLLVNNGIYKYNNLLFGITHAFSKEVTEYTETIDGEKKVSMHSGSTYSENNMTEMCQFNINDFKDYDLCLFGGTKNSFALTNDSSRWYSGSFIDHTEDTNVGKYILWNLATNKGESHYFNY